MITSVELKFEKCFKLQLAVFKHFVVPGFLVQRCSTCIICHFWFLFDHNSFFNSLSHPLSLSFSLSPNTSA